MVDEQDRRILTGWLMNASQRKMVDDKGHILTKTVLEVFIDDFREPRTQSLAFMPQMLLVDYDQSVIQAKFAWGFMQRVQISARVQTAHILTPQNEARERRTRQQIISLEENFTAHTIAGRVRKTIVIWQRHLNTTRQRFLAGRLSFEAYQSQELLAGQYSGHHLPIHLAGVQRKQKRIWTQFIAEVQRTSVPQLLLTDAHIEQRWSGPTITATEVRHGATQFSTRSKLPAVNKRLLRNPSYRQSLLQPLKRGYAWWVRAGRPVEFDIAIDKFDQRAFSLWQQYHRPTVTLARPIPTQKDAKA